MAVLGLRCCTQAFSSCCEQGLLFVVVHGLLIAVASLVAEHGLQACGLQQLWHVGSVLVAHRLQSAGSVVVSHGLSCSVACGIFLDQGSDLCSLHWQAILNHCATGEAWEHEVLTCGPLGKSQHGFLIVLFLHFLNIYLFIFGCVGSSLLRAGFLQLR